MNPFFARIGLSFAALGLTLSAPAAQPSSRQNLDPNYYAGIYVAARPGSSEKATDVYAMPQLDGVYISVKWNEIETRAGQFDWSNFDEVLDAAVRARKKVSIAVSAGGSAPDWLSDQVPHATFTVGAHGGRWGRCWTSKIPLPWSSDYQNAYRRMIFALRDHLRTRQGGYDAVRVVKLTGINQATNEMRLPAGSGDRADSCSSDAIAEWQKADYRPSKVVKAWDALSSIVAEAFPDKLLLLSILRGNDFPAISEAGQLSRRNSPDAVDVKASIVELGLKKFEGRFALQWNGLSATKKSDLVMDAGQRGAVIAWQTNLYKGRKGGSGCGAPSVFEAETCSNESYAAILQNGVQSGARYIEVWPVDAKKFPEALAAASRGLKRP